MDLTLTLLIGYALFLAITGYRLSFLKDKMTARAIAWVLAIATVLFSASITWEKPPLYRMIVIVTLQLLSMKSLVAVETYAGKMNLKFFQWMGFAMGWFGMRPVLFETLPSKSLSYAKLSLFGISRIVIGLLFLYLSRVIERSEIQIFFLSELVMLIGMSLILHFGLLNLSAAFWRFCGVDVKELFRAPVKSKSLKEFWGKRWNIAFSEMTSLIVYRPLKNSWGVPKATLVAFLVSGLLHEIAISFPVQTAYGLPLLYFCIHAALMFAENSLAFVRSINRHQIFSHIWVLGALITPMPLLFHPAFVAHVLVPLRDVILNILVP